MADSRPWWMKLDVPMDGSSEDESVVRPHNHDVERGSRASIPAFAPASQIQGPRVQHDPRAQGWGPLAADRQWVRDVTADGRNLWIRQQQDIRAGVGSFGARPKVSRPRFSTTAAATAATRQQVRRPSFRPAAPQPVGQDAGRRAAPAAAPAHRQSFVSRQRALHN